jgi:tetratricopeptide (TPR) repeat protein
VVDVYLSPPFWTASELGTLLRSSEIPFDIVHELQYLEVLATFSGGHPLLARGLARRSPTIPDLIASEVESAPALADEDLSDEVRALLYEEILTNPDSQNLVQRLSVLAGGTSSDVVEALRTEVQPQIATTASLIIEQVGGSVIEGDSANGYTVAFVFRKIAEQRISQEERQAVYRTAARTLLRPKGRILDAERTVWGIFYSFCLGDFDQVFFWATNLLLAADRQSWPEPILSALLLKLHFLMLIPPLGKFDLQVGHALTMCGFAAAHSRLKRYEDAANALENLRLDATAPESDSKLAQLMAELRFCVITYRAVLSAAARTGHPLQEISRLSTSDLASVSVKDRVVLLEVLPELVGKFPLADLSPELIRELVNEVEAVDDQKSQLLFRLAQSIGARAKDEHADSDSLRKFFTTSPFGEMLWQVATATFFIESGEGQRGLEGANRAIENAREIGSTSGGLWAYLHQLKGDAAYHEQAAPALDSYRESLQGLEEGSFGHAWSGWRIGLLSSDEQVLATAAEGFRALGHTEYWGRAWGARAAELIKSGKEREGLDCFLDLLDSYFLRKDEAVGPAVTIAQAHLTRLRHSLEGSPIPESDPAFPEIAGSPYELIPSGARPRVGPVTAFYNTALTYELLGDKTKAQDCLIKALNSDAANETDRGVLPLAIKMRLAALSDSDADRGEIARCIDLILACQSLDSQTSPAFLAFCLFHDVDEAFNSGGQIEKLENIVDLLGNALLNNKANEEFWKSEITLRRAKLEFRKGEMTDAVRLYREALQRGRLAKNGRVLLQAAHALGFELVNFSGSLKELAKQQFAFLEGAEVERDYSALNAFGQNLFHCWRKLEYKKLNVSDLDTKKYLMESAKAMDSAGISPGEAGAVMILLLGQLFNHSGPTLDSAKLQLTLDREILPENVSKLLKSDMSA